MREKRRENREKVIDAKPVGHYPHTLPHQEDNAKTIQMSLRKAIIGHWTSTYTSLEGHEGSPLVARVTKFF
jgi:hypothetical protein